MRSNRNHWCHANVTKGVATAAVSVFLWTGVFPAKGQSGPLAHYPLDGNANDVSGNGFNGSVEGAVTFVPAQLGLGAHFNGDSGQINLGNPAGLQISYPLSIATWFRRDSGSTTDDIIGHGCDGYIIWFHENGEWLQFGKQCGGQYVLHDGNLVGAFHHMAVTYDGQVSLIYVDGLNVAQAPMTQAFSNANPLWIGADPSRPDTERFNGVIDDLRIYGRVLSQCEIHNLALRPTLVGDVNCDCAVDLSDLSTLLAHFGTPSGATLADGDLDGNGNVDLSDLAILLAHFGSTCP